MSDATNVSVGKPKIGGAISVAPLGTPLPTSATEELDPAFMNLGYCSEDGLTNNNTPESDVIKAWGGDTVIVLQTSKEDTFAFTLLEFMNMNVMKFVYGDDNVSGDVETGLTIKANSKEQAERSIVIDMILKGSSLARIVIPNGKISEVGEVTYADGSAIGYPTTVTCVPDTNENTHYMYIQKRDSAETFTITVSDAVNGTVTLSKNTAEEGETITVTTTPASGYELSTLIYKEEGSSTENDIKSTGIFTMPAANVTVTATFTEIVSPVTSYTVTFNTNGADETIEDQTVEEGGKVTKPADPTKSSGTETTFAGWFKEDTFTTTWDFDNDTVTGNTTLYAKWEA